MRRSRIGSDTPLFRAHNPRWAYLPLSGEGAARAGGRFNRFGVAALYLSLDMETSAAEYQRDNDLTDPFLMVAYHCRLPELPDLRQQDDGWDALWHDWSVDWREMYIEGQEPPSWILGDLLLDAGEAGLIFPSVARPGGVNVVLYTEQLQPGWLLPHDPNGLLPQDQSSWKD